MLNKTNKSLKEKVYDSVYEDIIRGKYSVQTILTEKKLTEKYQVSKSPVREALIELCNDQVLISIPRKGYQIAQIVPRDLLDAIEFREIIELSAFEKTKQVLDDDIIDQLENHVNETLKIKDQHDVFKHWNRNIGFHLLLCSFSNNKWMYDTLESILKFCTRGATQFYSKIWESNKLKEANASAHVDLLNAIVKRDFKKCEDILVEDIYAMKNILF